MSNIFFTSDLHFMHDKPFLFTPRGFSSSKEMCEAIVERWNSIVKPGDIVYNLGDIALSDVDAAIPYLRQLNGKQIWLRGNHDTDNKIMKVESGCPNIHLIGAYNTSYATTIQDGKWTFYLSHYPTKTGNHEDWRRVANLCGHSHTQDRWLDWGDKCYHVEMDAHDCYPITLDQVKAEIKVKRQEELNI